MSSVIPIGEQESISYTDWSNLMTRTPYGYWKVLKTPIVMVQQMLRNAFFLPLYKKRTGKEFENNQKLAKEISHDILNRAALCSRGELVVIRRFFSMRDIAVELKDPVLTTSKRTFMTRVFESREPINGKKLRIVLIAFNGNTETHDNHTNDWNPLEVGELSKCPLSILKAFLKCHQIRAHSLVTNSLGSVVLDALPKKVIASDNIPEALVMGRGLTSVEKVTQRLYSAPLSYFFHGVTKLFRWNADPEAKLVSFIERNPLAFRKIVMIETPKDFYFSEEAAPDVNIHEKIAALGVSVFRARFWPFLFHSRSHHAISLEYLKNNSVTEILENTNSFFKLDQNEDMASAIANNIFFEGDEEWHNCFCVGGSDATPDIGTAREVLPFLEAFIKVGERRAQLHKEQFVI